MSRNSKIYKSKTSQLEPLNAEYSKLANEKLKNMKMHPESYKFLDQKQNVFENEELPEGLQLKVPPEQVVSGLCDIRGG